MDYINKSNKKNLEQPSTQPIANTSNKVTGIRGSDLRSNIQKYSAVITRDGVAIQQVNLLNICDLVPQGATLLVEIENTPYPLILSFLTEADQIQGTTRLTNMMNGQLVL